MTDDDPGRLMRPDGTSLAYHHSQGEGTGLVWLGGFRSDMDGTKATTLHDWARMAGRPFTRFDYFGHGLSGGDFCEGTISRWLADTLAILDEGISGPQVLIGSSMGGWLATLVALHRPDRVAGILYIAPAPDFTEELIWAGFTPEIKTEILQTGVYLEPSDYSPVPNPITRALIEDGRRHLVLGGPIAISCPVRILQGMRDPDVPWQLAMRLVDQIETDDVAVTLIKDGDHRLSRPQDLARLIDVAETICWEIEEVR